MAIMIRLALIAALVAVPANAGEPVDIYPDLLRTLIETDTTAATGSCTLASARLSRALIGAGFPAAFIQSYAGPDDPDSGGLVVTLPAAKADAGAILLVAHIDVVPASPSDWKHDPAKLTRQDGFFYGRGVSDNKGIAAALIELVFRLHREGFTPARSIKIGLTCGEETAGAFNGAQFLSTQRRDLIAADFAIVPTGGALLDAAGRKIALSIQLGEKVQENYRIEAAGTAGHASRPMPDNAIYALAEALLRVRSVTFPLRFDETAASQLRDEAIVATPENAAAIAGLLADHTAVSAAALVTANPHWNALLRTTCAATVVETDKQVNTIGARATATINCRLLPGTAPGMVTATLAHALKGLPVTLTALPPFSPTTPPPPLSPAIMLPLERMVAQLWPGVPVRRTMLTGATDARFLNAAGIPAYGLTVLFNNPDGDGVHAANERVRESSVTDARQLLYRLVKAYAGPF